MKAETCSKVVDVKSGESFIWAKKSDYYIRKYYKVPFKCKDWADIVYKYVYNCLYKFVYSNDWIFMNPVFSKNYYVETYMITTHFSLVCMNMTILICSLMLKVVYDNES